MIFVSCFLWMLAAICSAVQDTLIHHFPRSVFAAIESEAWRTWFESNWLNKGNYLFNLFDAWHTFKALMIVSLVSAVITFPDFKKRYLKIPFAIFLLLLWGLTFELFYSEILLVK